MAHKFTRVTLALSLVATFLFLPCNAAVSTDKQAFFNEIFLQNGDLPGLSSSQVGPKNLLADIAAGYTQGFTLGAEAGRVDYFLFSSGENASDTAQLYRNDIQCMLVPGLWDGFNEACVGDSSWYGNCMAPCLLVLRGELLCRVWFLQELNVADARRACVDIGARIVDKYNRGAFYVTPDTAYEECASRSSPPGARLMNRTAETLTVDSIAVIRAASSPALGLRFELGQSLLEVLSYDGGAVRLHVGCMPGRPGCVGEVYTSLSGPLQKIQVDPRGVGCGLVSFQIDTRVDTGYVYGKSYCTGGAVDMHAQVVFFAGGLSDTLTVAGWRNAQISLFAETIVARHDAGDHGAVYDIRGRALATHTGHPAQPTGIIVAQSGSRVGKLLPPAR